MIQVAFTPTNPRVVCSPRLAPLNIILLGVRLCTLGIVPIKKDFAKNKCVILHYPSHPPDPLPPTILFGDNSKGPKLTAARPAAKVRFAVVVEVRAEPTAEPTKQDQRAPIKMVSGRAWSPRIYQALRLLGKSLDVAWERAFIHPLIFN